MTLDEKILLADQMIQENRDYTVKDFLFAVACGREPKPVETPKAPAQVLMKTIFVNRERITFMYTYMGLISELKRRYKPTEDNITSRPAPDYSNRSPYGIATDELKTNPFDR